MHENNVAHRLVAFLRTFTFLICALSVTARPEILCSTRRICILSPFILPTLLEVRTFAERLSGIRERGVRQNTSSLTLAFPVDTILLIGHHSTNHTKVG